MITKLIIPPSSDNFVRDKLVGKKCLQRLLIMNAVKEDKCTASSANGRKEMNRILGYFNYFPKVELLQTNTCGGIKQWGEIKPVKCLKY